MVWEGSRNSARPQLLFSGPNLLSYLALQLCLRASQHDALAVCSYCGRTYTPLGRAPKTGQEFLPGVPGQGCARPNGATSAAGTIAPGLGPIHHHADRPVEYKTGRFERWRIARFSALARIEFDQLARETLISVSSRTSYRITDLECPQADNQVFFNGFSKGIKDRLRGNLSDGFGAMEGLQPWQSRSAQAYAREGPKTLSCGLAASAAAHRR